MTTTSPASVTPLSVATPETSVALVPALVDKVPDWICEPFCNCSEPVLPAAPRS